MARRLEVYEETDRRLRQALSPLIPEEPVIVFGSLTKTGVFRDRTDVDLALETEPAALGALRLIGELRERLDRPVDLVLLAGCRFREELVWEGGYGAPKTANYGELAKGVEVARAAVQTAQTRFAERSAVAYEGGAFQPTRCYQVIGQTALRLAKPLRIPSRTSRAVTPRPFLGCPFASRASDRRCFPKASASHCMR
jgi:predicted nucleotidyltransferase